MLRVTRFVAATGASKGVVRAGKSGLKKAGTAAAAESKKGSAAASSSYGIALAQRYAIAPGAEDDDDVNIVQPPTRGQQERDGEVSQQHHHHHQSGNNIASAAQQGQQHSHHDHRSGGKLHFDATKAGLQHVDKDYVEQVIQEASKGSAFYQKEQRLEETRRRKAEELQEKAKSFDSLSTEELRELKSRVHTIESELEATRDLRRRYIHIDMDMFYAAVEEKKKPELRGKPFGVGSLQMLSTTNYIARQYGVRSGMPGFIGKKLCPDLIIVPNDFPAYKREAARVHSIASRYDAQFVSVGLDELTMDVTKYLGEFPAVAASDIAHDFRDEVFLKTQLTSSGGIGPTSILAKIASNVNKPNGQHEITLLTREDVLQYVRDIPLRKIPGIGYSQEMTLAALHIHTCGDLLVHKYLLAYLFREKTLTHYLSVGLGVAETFSQRKHHTTQSVGKETSFYEPLPSAEAFTKMFRTLMEDCHARCVREQLRPRLMRLVLKYRTYDTQQFSQQLPMHTNDLKLWLEAAQKLLQPHLLQHAELRLVGVRMEKFETTEADAPSGGRVTAESLNSSRSADVDDVDEDIDEDTSDEAGAVAQKERAAEVSEVRKKKAPIPVSKFLSKPLAAARAPEKAVAASIKSVKSAVKRVKSSSSAARRKLRKKR